MNDKNQLDLQLYTESIKTEMYCVTCSTGTRPLIVGNNRKKLFEQVMKPAGIEYFNGHQWRKIESLQTFYRTLAHEITPYRLATGQKVKIEKIKSL